MTRPTGRLAILASHPVQYYAPLFRTLASKADIHVFYAHKTTPEQQAKAGFGSAFDWDVDLTSGYPHSWLRNVSKSPGTSTFAGCDTPEIAAALKSGGFTTLLVMGWHLKSMLQGMFAAKRLGIKLMVRGDSQLSTPRSFVKKAAKEMAYPVFLRTFDAALFVGARNKEYYEHFHYPGERLFHAPHCVDTDRFRIAATLEARQDLRNRFGISPNTKVILFAGKLVPFKRPLDVVEATHLLIRRGIDSCVMVAGAGELQEQMTKKAAELSVPLHLLGFQNQSEMPSCYAACDVLMLPSTARETWGLVCNEALACGRPIAVSADVGCSSDLLSDGLAGGLFGCGDLISAATRLQQIFSAPPDISQIRKVSDRHSLEAAASGIIEAFDALRTKSMSAGR